MYLRCLEKDRKMSHHILTLTQYENTRKNTLQMQVPVFCWSFSLQNFQLIFSLKKAVIHTEKGRKWTTVVLLLWFSANYFQFKCQQLSGKMSIGSFVSRYQTSHICSVDASDHTHIIVYKEYFIRNDQLKIGVDKVDYLTPLNQALN